MRTMKNKGSAEFLDAFEVIPEQLKTYTRRESVVSVFPSAPSDATDAQVLGLIEQSGILDFWIEEGEDIYSHNDGQQI